MALDSAGLTLKDIQSVVSGSAPDAFDGVHMKGEYYLDGMGAIGKPTSASNVGGGTGVFTPIGGWWNVASGMYDTCLCVAEEKMVAFAIPILSMPSGASSIRYSNDHSGPLCFGYFAGDEEVHAQVRNQRRRDCRGSR